MVAKFGVSQPSLLSCSFLTPSTCANGRAVWKRRNGETAISSKTSRPLAARIWTNTKRKLLRLFFWDQLFWPSTLLEDSSMSAIAPRMVSPETGWRSLGRLVNWRDFWGAAVQECLWDLSSRTCVWILKQQLSNLQGRDDRSNFKLYIFPGWLRPSRHCFSEWTSAYSKDTKRTSITTAG